MKSDIEILGLWATQMVLDGDVVKGKIVQAYVAQTEAGHPPPMGEMGGQFVELDEIETMLWNTVLLQLIQERQ